MIVIAPLMGSRKRFRIELRRPQKSDWRKCGMRACHSWRPYSPLTCWQRLRVTRNRRAVRMNENTIKAIMEALSKGLRVELLRDKNGDIIVQTIQRKRMKI